MQRLVQLVVVLLTDLLNTVLSIQPLSNDLVSLHKLVNLLGKLIVLVADDANVIVHGVNLNLQVGVVLQQGLVRVARALQLLPHVHQLVFLLADLDLQLLDGSAELDIGSALLVNSLLQVAVFVLVALLQRLKMVKLTDEVVHLLLKRGNVSVRVG